MHLNSQSKLSPITDVSLSDRRANETKQAIEENKKCQNIVKVYAVDSL
jgi:hypothetical protein